MIRNNSADWGNRFSLLLIFLSAFILAASTVHAQVLWPQFGGNAARNSVTDLQGPKTSAKQWTISTGQNPVSPLVTANGSILTPTGSNTMGLHDVDGNLIWNVSISSSMLHTPAICGSTVQAGTSNGVFHFITTAGTSSSTLSGGFTLAGPIAVTSQNTSVIVSPSGEVRHITETGATLWSAQTGKTITTGAALDANNAAYFGTSTGELFCFNSTGVHQWNATVGDAIHSTPAIDANGTIHFGSNDNNFYAYYPNGTQKWAIPTGSDVLSSPAIAADGTIYFGCSDFKLYAVANNGAILWTHDTGSPITSSPLVDGKGSIYVGNNNGELLHITSNGTLMHSYKAGAAITSSPVIPGNDRLAFTSTDGKLYALVFDHFPNDDAAWKDTDGDGAPDEWDLGKTAADSTTGLNKDMFPADPAASRDTDGDGHPDQWTAGATQTQIAATPLTLDPNPYKADFPGNAWRMSGKDPQRSGRTALTGPSSNKTLWVYDAGAALKSDAVIGADGTIYLHANNGYMHALHPNGTTRWKYAAQTTANEASPVITDNGTVFFSYSNGLIRALQPDEALVLSTTHSGQYSSPMHINGTTYFNTKYSTTSYIYTYHEDGTTQTLNYDYDTTTPFSDPALTENDKLYFANAYGLFTSAYPFTSHKMTHGGKVGTDLAAQGDLVAYAIGTSVYARYTNGTQMYSYAAGSTVNGSPTFDKNGVLYIGTNDGYLHAINPNGSLRWKVDLGTTISSKPLIDAAGTIHVGTENNLFHALDEDGNILWSLHTGGAILASPSMGPNGVLYVPSTDGKLYALQPKDAFPNDPAAWSDVDGDGTPDMWAAGMTAANSTTGLKLDAFPNDPAASVDADKDGYPESWNTGMSAANSTMGLHLDHFPTDPAASRDSDEDGYPDYWTPGLGQEDSTTGLLLDAIPDDPAASVDTDGDGYPDQWNTGYTQANSTTGLTLDVFASDPAAAVDTDGDGSPDDWTKGMSAENSTTGLTKDCFPNDPAAVADSDNDGLPDAWLPGKNSTDSTTGLTLDPNPDLPRDHLNGPWPTYHGDNFHTGRSLYEGPQVPQLKWTASFGHDVYSSPVITDNGTILVGSRDNTLRALWPNGTTQWSYKTGGYVESTPAVDKNGIIYFGSKDGWMYALENNGTLKWKTNLNEAIQASPTISANGTIYIGGFDNKMHALHPNGTIMWKFATGGDIVSSAAIGQDGTIYFGSNDNNLYALYPNGTKKWHYGASHDFYSSPAIGPEGTIYATNLNHVVYALNPNGTQQWVYNTNNDLYSSPAVDKQGNIYFGCNSGYLYCLTPDGKYKWQRAIGSTSFHSSPVIDPIGNIYVGSSNYYIRCINSTGSIKWSYHTGASVYSTPAIGPDGTLYVGSNDNKLYAIANDPFVGDAAAAVDSDSDGYPDNWEAGKTAADSTMYLNLDAFPNDPAASRDTDGDGKPDMWNSGATQKQIENSQLVLDTDDDNDGMSDVDELAAGFDPQLVDTDGDGYPDNLDSYTANSSATIAMFQYVPNVHPLSLNAKERYTLGLAENASLEDVTVTLNGTTMQSGMTLSNWELHWSPLSSGSFTTEVIFTRSGAAKRTVSRTIQINVSQPQFSFDNNDNTGTAETLTLSKAISADIETATDVDYYAVTVPKAAVYRVRMLPFSGTTVDTNVEVTTALGSTLAQTTVGTESAWFLLPIEQGTVYVRVDCAGSFSQTYNYALLVEPVAEGSFGSQTNANDLGTYQGLLSHPQESHTYSFTSTQTMCLNLDLATSTGLANPAITLNLSNGTTVLLSGTKAKDAYLILPSGSHSMSISIDKTVIPPMHYTLSLVNSGLSESEPNDDKTQASPLPINGTSIWAEMYPGEKDVFKLVLTKPQALTIDLLSENNVTHNMVLGLAGQAIYTTSSNTVHTALFPGTYYLTVTGAGDDLYRLQTTPLLDKMEFEPNNGPTYANALSVGSTAQGNTYSSADKDWFSFQLDQEGPVIIGFSSSQATACQVAVYNIAGVQRATWNGSTPTMYKPLKAGTYYVCVNSTTPVSYTLSITGEGIAPDFKELLGVSLSAQQNLNAISQGDTVDLVLTGTYTDGSTVDLTSVAKWTNLTPSVISLETNKATVLTTGSASVLATAKGLGSTMSFSASAQVKQSYGNLILVAGGGLEKANLLKESTQFLCDTAYKKFLDRGFKHEDIHYLTPQAFKDLDGNGFDDEIVDNVNCTTSGVITAITSWAKDYASDGPLYIYLSGHGDLGKFMVNSGQTLTASQLVGALNVFAQTGRDVVILMEACHSGSFISILKTSQADLVVTTSSDAAHKSFIAKGGAPSYSITLLNYLGDGADLQYAHDAAVESLLAEGSSYATQNPQIGEFGVPADKVHVVNSILNAPILPTITSIELPPSIALGESLSISAKVTGVEGGRVWAMIRPQNYAGKTYTSPDGVIYTIDDSPTIDLTDGGEADKYVIDGEYSAIFTDIQSPGVYEVGIYGLSKNNTPVFSGTKIVTVTGSGLTPPSADFAAPQTIELNTPITFTANATDADGSIASWHWDFGDGSTATGQTVQHSFSQGTQFTVTLTVTDDSSLSDTASKIILVGTQPQVQTISFQAGWNLLGLSLEPLNPDVSTMFGTSSSAIESIWGWKNDNWAVMLPNADTSAFVTAKGFTELTDLHAGQGFWVSASSSGSLSMNATSGPATLALSPGWCLAAATTENSNLALSSMLATLPQNALASVWTFSNGNWNMMIPDQTDLGQAYCQSKGFGLLESIPPKKGFWVNCAQEATLPLQ